MAQGTRMNVIDRLAKASTLLARQQHERAAWGGSEEFHELREENRLIAEQALPIVEQALDEDLYAQLDREEGWQAWFDWPPPVTMPFDPSAFFPFPAPLRRRGRGGSAGAVRSTDPLLDRVIGDFAARMNSLVRRTRMEGHSLDGAEVERELESLREDLRFFAERHARSRDLDEEDSGRPVRAERSRHRSRSPEGGSAT